MADRLPLIDRFRIAGPYRLMLWFDDGRRGEWDFARLADETRPVYQPFKDPAFFAQVFLEFGALTWPNGFDLSPVTLHDAMTAAGALSKDAARAA